MDERDIVETFNSLKDIYQFQFHLKDEQMYVLRGTMNKRNVFALLPTGYGKSMCFTLPPLLLDELDWTIQHIAVVISPLKSLMADQVNSLTEVGVRAIAISPDMQLDTYTDIKQGKYSIVFISPESATSKFWRNIFLSDDFQKRICLLACDEAHCISEWGEDFRPVYRDVINLRSLFVGVPVLAVTATCDEKVREDVFKSLSLEEETLTIAIAPDRPNIYLDFRASKQDHELELQWLIEYLTKEGINAKKIIVYCRSVTATATLYNHVKDCLLQQKKSTELIDMFHRSIDERSTTRVLDSFKMQDSTLRCLFATVAFGMGIQIPDIQIVVHWGLPKSVLSYWQEIGRAGRDGRQAYAICYAYGRSMIKKITDENIILIAKSSLQIEMCARFLILQHMKIKGMADFDIQENGRACTGLGKLCPAFKCCSFCSAHCACNNTTIEQELGISQK